MFSCLNLVYYSVHQGCVIRIVASKSAHLLTNSTSINVFPFGMRNPPPHGLYPNPHMLNEMVLIKLLMCAPATLFVSLTVLVVLLFIISST